MMSFNIITSSFIIIYLAHLSNGQAQTGPKHGKSVMCYVASYAIYRGEPAKFDLKDVEASRCTHLVYAFAVLNGETNKIKSADAALDTDGKFVNGGYRQFAGLKKKFPHLKVIVSLGGWQDGSIKYSNMAASKSNRTAFINSAVDFMKKYNFDGISIHWKWPTLRGGKSADKANFVTLLKELKEAFLPFKYEINVITAAYKYILTSAYDFPQINEYVDYFHLLAYDYHGSWDRIVGANSPIVGLNEDDVYNVEYSIKYMLSHGVSASKVILCLSLYGRTFILEDPDVEEIEFGGTSTKREGFAGPFTKDKGFIIYNEICLELTKNSDNWTRHWHDQAQVPYIRNKERVITYDNARSLAVKVKKVIEYDLAGVMVWAMDSDDFNGVCDHEPEYVSVSFSALHRFVQKFNQVTRNPVLKRLLKDVNMEDAQKLETLTSLSTGAQKTHLWAANPNPKYPMLRAIDESIYLALEEKMVMMDMMDVMAEKLKTETTTTAPSTSTNSLFTVVCQFCFI